MCRHLHTAQDTDLYNSLFTLLIIDDLYTVFNNAFFNKGFYHFNDAYCSIAYRAGLVLLGSSLILEIEEAKGGSLVHGVIIIKFIVQLASINIQNYNFSYHASKNAACYT